MSGIIHLHVDIKYKILELHRGISFTRRGSLLYTLEAGSAAEVQNRLLRLALVSRRSSEKETQHTRRKHGGGGGQRGRLRQELPQEHHGSCQVSSPNHKCQQPDEERYIWSK